ncbi:MAG: cytochrome c family protein [Halioglobus sp.]|nr:cytochrome c family protein [Halioglobus sp.]|tara:strand:+ start:2847 stop:3266 length:420 start_codon:yes stop_codon:yes gene_type:complete
MIRRRRPHLRWLPVLLCAGVASAAPAGDPIRGASIYQRCLACHALSYHRVGPKHCGLLGRRAGRAPGYEYSAAMRDAGFTWSQQTLDAFLAAPTQYLPGTSMGYAGVRDARDRRDLIAFIAGASRDTARCPPAQGSEAQ